ncbi:pectate lyase-like [Lolium rigidum]|uniref:pectate lyase-like n=1 Tax=Lolium rigidum TaxID=89674 RepID=UPI001F5D3B2F|nr:pectate lyase-like [Lolium rigidum]XP_047044015.1 pectate lyase-like [Lolium rigidum]
MAILLFLFFTSILPVSYTSPLPISENSTSNNISSHRRTPTGSCGTGNPVDDCWRCDPSWATNRQRLADCAIGFGRNALGGKNGRIYVVTDPGDDDPARPAPGTLRYGLAQHEPLWIVFDRDMTIRPRQELLVSSYKTVDGRGARVVVGDGGACFTLRNVSNVIIHGVTIRHCRPARKSARGWELSDGDGVTVFRSRDVWVDRCSLEDCADGLVDVIEASTAVTVSNCLMTNHDKAMLLGHNDAFSDDRGMRVTVAFNRFGPGLVQRMPRCRFGVFHVVNNDYVSWEKYAIGGSASPTILSQGNRFCAGKEKEVTKRDGDPPNSEWRNWSWISDGDLMLNGAFFRASGRPGPAVKAPSFVKSASFVAPMTASAGALSCNKGCLC